MIDHVKVKTHIKNNEGFRRRPYKCSAEKLTIGYGRNLDANGITALEADLMLKNDIHECVYHLTTLFPSFGRYPTGCQVALIDMRYNLGHSRLMKFGRMIAAVHREDWPSVAIEIEDSKYYKQVTSRADRNIALILHGAR